MSYTITSLIGASTPGVADTTAQFALGQMADGVDATQGAGKFVYLKSNVSAVAGSVVSFDTYTGTTTLATAGTRGPIAVALGNVAAGQYSFHQVGGVGTVKSATVAALGSVYMTSTAGTVDDAVVSGDKIDGMRFITANGTPATGFAYVEMFSPMANANG